MTGARTLRVALRTKSLKTGREYANKKCAIMGHFLFAYSFPVMGHFLFAYSFPVMGHFFVRIFFSCNGTLFVRIFFS